MNEEYIRQLAKETFEEQISEEIKKHLDSGIIFKYISDIENELQSYKQKEDKLREYITSYESISIIQGLNDTIKNKDLDENTMIEMTNRYLEVHDKLLQILNEGSDENE